MVSRKYTVKQVADMSGISIRTLHYYEQIGLLVPQRMGNGYRAYALQDLVRLQQILLYRSCGVELAEISKMLDSDGFDARGSLEEQLDILLDRKKKIDDVISTVRKTIEMMDGKAEMEDDKLFEGLKAEKIARNEAEYGEEARRLYGDEAVDAANASLLGMDKDQWKHADELEKDIVEQLKLAHASGDVDGPEARKLCQMHEQWLRMQWGEGAYSRKAHLGLAKGYLADQRFIDYYDSRSGSGSTQFLVEALERYCS